MTRAIAVWAVLAASASVTTVMFAQQGGGASGAAQGTASGSGRVGGGQGRGATVQVTDTAADWPETGRVVETGSGEKIRVFKVTTGLTDGNDTEISGDGLTEGAEIIVSAKPAMKS